MMNCLMINPNMYCKRFQANILLFITIGNETSKVNQWVELEGTHIDKIIESDRH